MPSNNNGNGLIIDEKGLVRREKSRYYIAEPLSWIKGSHRARRTIKNVELSRTERSKSIIVEEPDGLAAIGGRTGYRSILANEGVFADDFYFECMWTGPPDSSIRFGVATARASLMGPIGLDEHGFAWCPDGSLFHRGKKTPFSAPFKQGDILGCRIRLSSRGDGDEDESSIAVDIINQSIFDVVTFNKLLYLEQRTSPSASPESITMKLRKATIRFYKNGLSQGLAFEGLLLDRMLIYPAFSLYGNAQLEVNFGPLFLKRPDNSVPWSAATLDNAIISSLAELKDLLINRNDGVKRINTNKSSLIGGL